MFFPGSCLQFFFFRAPCCFPAAKKTRSIPPPDAGQPRNCLHILTTVIRVLLVDMSVPWQTPTPIVKDVFPTEIVMRDARNWVFFDPFLQLIESLWVAICL